MELLMTGLLFHSCKKIPNRHHHKHMIIRTFPGGHSGKEPACQCRRLKRCRFDPWIAMIPWRRARQPTLAFLPGESRGQRSLGGYSPWGHTESDTTEATMHVAYSALQLWRLLLAAVSELGRVSVQPPAPCDERRPPCLLLFTPQSDCVLSAPRQ